MVNFLYSRFMIMSRIMSVYPPLALALLASLILYAFVLRRGLDKSPEAPEPPRVALTVPIPWLGHISGVLNRRMQYFGDIGYGVLGLREEPVLISIV